MAQALGVALCGALGALCRWGLGLAVGKLGAFPAGTLAANLLGCLLLGLLTGLGAERELVPAPLRLPLATGFLGSFTTFSTFSVETVQLAQRGHSALAVANVLVSIVGGLGGAVLGLWLARRGG
jgi:CrcB protein